MRRARASSRFGLQWLERRLFELAPTERPLRICVALSGGLDSTVLLAALAAVRDERPGRIVLRAAHVDHGLHASSGRWSAHCRLLARSLRVPLVVRRTRVERRHGESLEAVAREQRYGLLAQVVRPREILALAHHEDDQLETVLLQLLRGAGLPGLAAMPAVAPFADSLLVRPLLGCSRDELLQWAQSRGLRWIEDPSNADERLERNYLRHRLLPTLRERWPSAASAVSRTAAHAAQAQRLLARLAAADLDRCADGADLSIPTLRTLDADRRGNLLRHWISSRGHPVPDARLLQQILGPMLLAREDAHPQLQWGCSLLRRERHVLTLESAPPGGTAPPLPAPSLGRAWRLHESARYALPQELGSLELEPDAHGAVDLDALPDEVQVRFRVRGAPLPGRAGRSLKKRFQDGGVSARERARAPLLFDGERLVAVISRGRSGVWLDDSVRAGPASLRRAHLRWRAPAEPR